MNNDKHLARWLFLLILLPVGLAAFSGDRFRYPCQDPENWGSKECQKPTCEVTRTCPEYIFKPEVLKGTATPAVTVANKGKECN